MISEGLFPVEVPDGGGRGVRRPVVAARPAEAMRVLLEHEPTRHRYQGRIWRDARPGACWPWLGGLSSTGHGKLRAGGGRAADLVSAHVYGWALAYGPVDERGLVVAHRCDEPSCQRPDHWELIERRANTRDYLARRTVPGSPLGDERGAAGRARAIRDAVVHARRHGADVAAAVDAVKAAGLPVPPAGLFEVPRRS